MRKLCILLILIAALSNDLFAQANVSINDIAKIHLVNGVEYLGGSFKNDYELVVENGQWKSDQTHEKYERINGRVRDPKKMREVKDSAMRKFIRIIPNDSVALFLRTISVIKPGFILSDLKISIPNLTQQIDTSVLKKLDKKRVRLFNSFFDTPAKLHYLLNEMQNQYVSDYSPYSKIEIVKKQGDTVTLTNRNQQDYMLPWSINAKATYDFKINEFFITATGLTEHPMAGKNIYNRIADLVYMLYANDAFERLRMQELAPDNFDYIKRHFDIIEVSQHADRLTPQYTSFTFQPKNISKHVQIRGSLDITNKSQLISLVNFSKDSIATIIKKGGFIIDSCFAKPGCHITFASINGEGYHRSSLIRSGMGKEYLKNYTTQQLWSFGIQTPEVSVNNWMVLSDGKFVFMNFGFNKVFGVKPVYLKKQLPGKFVFMVFDHDGELIFDAD